MVTAAPQLILFGSSGRSGQRLHAQALAQGFTCLCPSHRDLPLENSKAISDFILAHPQASAVINCAAMSSLEACLDDALSAHLINALAPAQMALACRHTGARFIHLSTDYVLDGRRSGFKDESSKCRPTSLYGHSKWEAEQQVLEANDSAIIARVSWICGNASRPSFVEQSLTKALAGEPLAAIADKFSLPTHASDLARACLAMLSIPQARGVVHLCSSASVALSWWDCASIALHELLARGAIRHLPEIARQELSSIRFFRDERPRCTAMSNSRLTQDWGIPMPLAHEAIAQAVNDFLTQRLAQ